VEVIAEMSDEELAQFEQDVRPIKLMIAKIRSLAFKIINSTTKLLPAWNAACAELGMKIRLLPRDVRTRWNSTYDMLETALKYRKVVDAMCADK
ncbi:hypothetical protein C8Q76DRAFT_598751, partial [Earliella scabrosa]